MESIAIREGANYAVASYQRQRKKEKSASVI